MLPSGGDPAVTAHDRAMTRRGRWSRAAGFAAVSLGLAMVAHRLGGDALPRLPILAATAVVLLAAGRALVSCRRALPVAAAMVVTQLGAHVGFALDLTRGRAVSLDLVLCRSHAGPTGLTASGPSFAMHSTHRDALVMLAGHAVAAALTGLWMHRADRLAAGLWPLLRTLRRFVRCLRMPVTVRRHSAVRRLAAWSAAAQALQDRAIGPIGVRGPPLPRLS